jgi:molybdopterin molybdotransferase
VISVEAALDHVLGLVAPIGTETVPLRAALRRVLAAPVVAARNQPPFRAAVMDGYAVLPKTVTSGERFQVMGEAAAGHGFAGDVGPGEAVRIFTGAPMPEGANRVVIQEDVIRDGDVISIGSNPDQPLYVRDLGADFKVGDTIDAPRRLRASDIALIAAMNRPEVCVARKPVVALMATGDELVMPGETPSPDQIIASNTFGLAAMIEAEGGEARVLPIARDTRASLEAAFELARGADLIVTIGGASEGDHDLVGGVAEGLGMERAFYKIAMRPGKPLMAGLLDGIPMLGLPGNPVSSMVCGHIFIRPMIAVMLGLPARALLRRSAMLSAPLPPNGPREHYMRASFDDCGIRAAERQDSALLSVLAAATALIVRPPHDGARDVGDTVEYVDISQY